MDRREQKKVAGVFQGVPEVLKSMVSGSYLEERGISGTFRRDPWRFQCQRCPTGFEVILGDLRGTSEFQGRPKSFKGLDGFQMCFGCSQGHFMGSQGGSRGIWDASKGIPGEFEWHFRGFKRYQ